MSDIKDKVAELEATETALQAKKTELEAVSAETETAKADKQTQMDAMTAELARVQSDIAAAKEERRKAQEKDTSFQQKLRDENLEAAKLSFFTKFNVKPEEQASFLEQFKKFDSQAVNADLIVRDMRATYAYLHADELIDTKQKVDILAEGSEELKAQMSSMGFTGGSPPPDGSGLTAEDIQAAQWAGIPLETYKQLKAQGKV